MRTLALVPSATLWIALLLVGCRSSAETPSDFGSGSGPDSAATLRVVVASDLDNPPFAFVDAQGRPAGRDVEMMKRLAARGRLELVWRRLPFEALLPAAAAGEVDVVCATLGITAERAASVRFSEPYFTTRIVAVCRRGEREPAQLDDLAGELVAAAAGTTAESALAARLPAARPAPSAKGVATDERLLAGAIRAAILDEPAARALVARHPERLTVLDEPLATERYALALRPGASALLARLDQGLAALRDAGELTALDERHGVHAR